MMDKNSLNVVVKGPSPTSVLAASDFANPLDAPPSSDKILLSDFVSVKTYAKSSERKLIVASITEHI
jgi:hypothetical protein